MRLKIENLKELLCGTPLMRMALEDLFTVGDCFILLSDLREGKPGVLPAKSINVMPNGYQQVLNGRIVGFFADDQVIHFCKKSLRPGGAVA